MREGPTEDLLLVVEIAYTSEKLDRAKATVYVRAGVRTYYSSTSQYGVLLQVFSGRWESQSTAHARHGAPLPVVVLGAAHLIEES